MMRDFNANTIKWNDAGLAPAIVQSEADNRVLMLAWMNEASLARSIEIGETVFFSRSRNELWHKGASSGNKQVISKIQVDCDADALLITVKEVGPACHTGARSCFDSDSIEL